MTEARFTRATAAHSHETPLSDDQTIEGIDVEHVLVTASVRDTAQIEWWLLGFGEGVTVQDPSTLRERIAEGHQRAARQCHDAYEGL